MEEILKVEQIAQTYQAENGELTALENISFSVKKVNLSALWARAGAESQPFFPLWRE